MNGGVTARWALARREYHGTQELPWTLLQGQQSASSSHHSCRPVHARLDGQPEPRTGGPGQEEALCQAAEQAQHDQEHLAQHSSLPTYKHRDLHAITVDQHWCAVSG